MQHIAQLDTNKFRATGVRIAYPDLAQARSFKNDSKNTPRFSCTCLIPKSDKASYDLLKGAIDELAKTELKKAKIAMADTCLRDGDESNQEAYHDNWVLSLYRYPDDKRPRNNAPAVVGPVKVDGAFVQLQPGDDGYPFSGSTCTVIFDLYVAKKWGKVSGGFSTVQSTPKPTDEVIGGSGDIAYLEEAATDGL